MGQTPGFDNPFDVSFSRSLCEVAIFSLIAGDDCIAQGAFLMVGHAHRIWIVELEVPPGPVKTHYAV